jgi:isoleucyl-tRNA synthetase
MKASLSSREPLQAEEWDRKDVYGRLRESRKGRPVFFLHDGPPYANGHIHMGHALNKILKDFVVKYKNLKGFDAPYVPGWDCHGLPIEHRLLKDLNKTVESADQVSFRREAHAFALRWMETQKKEFKRLGIFGDWDNPYLTLDKDYEVAILKTLQEIHRAGYMYKAKKPVYWSVGCETALAEAEVEYAEHDSPSIFVRFPLAKEENRYLVIWTTTPWTLPANLAVAVNESFRYTEVLHGEDTYLVARDLAEKFIEQCGLRGAGRGREFDGRELEGLCYRHPFLEREGKILLSEFVNLETGTGLVHTAPGHGQEDYVIGLRYGLDVFSPVDEKGRFTAEAGVFEGMPVFEANDAIIELLKRKKALLHQDRIVHSYPHCWRSKQPIIFRATEQWFISMDHNDLRKRSLENIRRVRWIPGIGESRISAMVEGRPDWCISRQRLWGVPIPSLRCRGCGASFFDDAFVDALVERVREKGVDTWFETPALELAPPETACPKCRARDFVKENDIVDVWFESGVSYRAALREQKDMPYPVDLYLEGSDQHRGWFQSSLMTAAATNREAPYRAVLTHGFVVDAEGKKMSKSLGNVIDPLKVIERYGADILRLWAASSDYTQDLKLSENHFVQISDSYRKVRNTLRFLLGNLADFNPETPRPDWHDLEELDRWILVRLGDLLGEMETDMEEYRFYRAWNRVYIFCNQDLSALYLNIHKDTLYCAHPTSKVRRSAQTAMDCILRVLVRALFPFISYTAEEAWKHIPRAPGERDTAAFEEWPRVPGIENAAALRSDFDRLFELRLEAYRKIEGLIANKTIRGSLQAEITFTCADEREFLFLDNRKEALKRFFIVSGIAVERSSSSQGGKIQVDVSPRDGLKCQRCWMVFKPEESAKNHDDLCLSCSETVQKLENEG